MRGKTKGIFRFKVSKDVLKIADHVSIGSNSLRAGKFEMAAVKILDNYERKLELS
jgi:hypothetical protein